MTKEQLELFLEYLAEMDEPHSLDKMQLKLEWGCNVTLIWPDMDMDDFQALVDAGGEVNDSESK
jgi:hypothetical protein